MTVHFTMKNPEYGQDILGLIPYFLDSSDPRRAAAQFDASYQHGGGWRPMAGFTVLPSGALQYRSPGEPDGEDSEDEPLECLAEARFRDETIRFYDCSFVGVFQRDGSFEVSRMD